MCFEADALPPRVPADRVIPMLAGGAGAERLTLESADGSRFAAALWRRSVRPGRRRSRARSRCDHQPPRDARPPGIDTQRLSAAAGGLLDRGGGGAAGRSLPDMSLAFALMAAINRSTGSSATLSHGLQVPPHASPASARRHWGFSSSGVAARGPPGRCRTKGSRCATRRRQQRTSSANARDRPLIDGPLRRGRAIRAEQGRSPRSVADRAERCPVARCSLAPPSPARAAGAAQRATAIVGGAAESRVRARSATVRSSRNIARATRAPDRMYHGHGPMTLNSELWTGR